MQRNPNRNLAFHPQRELMNHRGRREKERPQRRDHRSPVSASLFPLRSLLSSSVPSVVLLFLLFCGLTLGFPLAAQPRTATLAIAAAGDLRGTLEEVKGAFVARHPSKRIDLSFGASGSLTAQIQQGAPFDVFLSADAGFPEQLRQAGLASPEGPFPYARGFLTLWVRRDLGLDTEHMGLRVLLDTRIKRIALANPKVAPYGRAAEAALKQAGIQEALQPRFVFGDNIAQAAQFLQAGAAEAGLISQSQARHPALKSAGTTWKVPEDLAPPLRQSGVILAHCAAPALARAFRDFLIGAEGQAILSRHGFGQP